MAQTLYLKSDVAPKLTISDYNEAVVTISIEGAVTFHTDYKTAIKLCEERFPNWLGIVRLAVAYDIMKKQIELEQTTKTEVK